MNDDQAPSVSTRWTFEHCPLCRSAIAETTSPPVPDRDGGTVEFRCCPTCLTLFPARPDEIIDAAEETARQADYHGNYWGDVNLEQLDLLASRASQLAWEVAEFLPPPARSGKIVDIGAGRGNIIHAISRLGYPILGCEPSAFLCQVARAAYLIRPDVLSNTDADTFLRGLAASDTTVDGYVLWHVLEHFRDPLGLLEQCQRVGPSAMFFIELPIALDEDIFPEHLFFPTPASLVRLADRLDLVIEHLSVTTVDNRLRVYYRSRDPEVVDLGADGRSDADRSIDLASIEADYRALSPAFAHFLPEPTASIDSSEKAEIGSSGRGS